MGKNTNTTVFIFSSPEKLLENFWNEILKTLILSETFKMCCVDEVHQFVSYGCFFRYKFENLRESLFRYLIVDKESESTKFATFTNIPLLFMTATFSTVMKDTLEKIIGINILRENIFWGNVQDMMRRNINIGISCHAQYFNNAKSEI